MFRRHRNFNDLLKEFDEMFGQFESRMNLLSSNIKIEESSDDNGWRKETYSSPDGSFVISSYFRTNVPEETTKNSGINSLRAKLQIAIDEENFEEAVKLRDEIKKYESNQESIKKLESDLKKSIEEEDFEKSIQIRDELKKLKS
jgi:excinuclease UvrABC helicase subunit UvrB